MIIIRLVQSGELFCLKDYEEKYCKTCTGCQNKITSGGRVISTKIGYFHPDHFRCAKCNCLLSGLLFCIPSAGDVTICFVGDEFFIRNRSIYCKEHIKEVKRVLNDLCPECGKKVNPSMRVTRILDEVMPDLEAFFHFFHII